MYQHFLQTANNGQCEVWQKCVTIVFAYITCNSRRLIYRQLLICCINKAQTPCYKHVEAFIDIFQYHIDIICRAGSESRLTFWYHWEPESILQLKKNNGIVRAAGVAFKGSVPSYFLYKNSNSRSSPPFFCIQVHLGKHPGHLQQKNVSIRARPVSEDVANCSHQSRNPTPHFNRAVWRCWRAL